VGQRVQVSVMSVDLARNRIALTMKRAAAPAGGTAPRPEAGARGGQGGSRSGARADARPSPKAFAPKPGAVAPNGMRFK